MESNSCQPLIVSGIHRSGSTWVGEQIAALANYGYIQEPFNQDLRSPPVLGIRLPEWYYFLFDGNCSPFVPYFDRLFAFRLSWWRMPLYFRSRFHIRRSLDFMKQFASYRKKGATPLVKDPIALLSTPWLAHRYGFKVILLTRHPCAFVASVLNWGFCNGDLGFLHRQRILSNRFGPTAERVFGEIPNSSLPPLEEAIWIWKYIHAVIAHLREEYPEWIVLSYEDLASDPARGFTEILEQLQIDGRTTSGAWGQERRKSAGKVWNDTRLDGGSSAYRWRNELTPAQISKIKEETAPEWEAFYTDDQW